MRVVYLMAADQEYGPELRRRITPMMVGIGPVEAAVRATRTLTELSHQGALPDMVVSLGSAGSATLEHTGVYQARSVSYRDMDASALGFAPGVTPLVDCPAEVQLAPLIPGLKTARLSTGGDVVTGARYDEIDADMVDMESFAIMRACQAFNVPLIVLRGISDGQTGLSGMSDWTRYLHIVDEKLAGAVDLVQSMMANGDLERLKHSETL